MLYKEQVYSLAINALDALLAAQEKGRVPKNAKSENHFFSAWVTKSLKEKLFTAEMAPLLKHWQQCARTQGANANLVGEFEQIKHTYQLAQDANQLIKLETIEALIESLGDDEWQIDCESVITKKYSIKKEKTSSLCIDCEKLVQAFDESGNLVSTLSIFIRGDQQGFIDCAHALGILVFKITDYKSIVKFHGELIIAPNNNAKKLAQFVTKT